MTAIVKPGTYTARLTGVHEGLSKAGNLMVVMDWELQNGTKLRKFAVVQKADGTRMDNVIKALKRLFPEWDGFDTGWFGENPLLFENLIADLVIVEGKPYNGRPCANIRWINNLRKDPNAAHEETVYGELPAEIEPNEASCWRAYVQVHYDGENPDSVDPETWLRLREKMVPGKDLIDYTTSDWQKVADELRRRYGNGPSRTPAPTKPGDGNAVGPDVLGGPTPNN